MREIKFRAWTGKWMDNDFFIHSDGTTYDSAARTYDTPNTEIETVAGLTLMQFTGLRDKNGKEVYEGDIVKRDEIHGGEVKWWPEGAAFLFGRFTASTATINYTDIEVIGNIYENPELVEGKS